MTDEEAIIAFRRLSGTLKEIGCQWLLDQVQETINLGKLTRAEVVDYAHTNEIGTTEEESADFQLPAGIYPPAQKKKKKGRRVEVDRVESYTPVQRLQLLVRAIERTFVDTVRMQEAVLTRLSKFKNVHAAEAVIGLDDQESQSLSFISVPERREAIDRLSNQLTKLRTEAV